MLHDTRFVIVKDHCSIRVRCLNIFVKFLTVLAVMIRVAGGSYCEVNSSWKGWDLLLGLS